MASRVLRQWQTAGTCTSGGCPAALLRSGGGSHVHGVPGEAGWPITRGDGRVEGMLCTPGHRVTLHARRSPPRACTASCVSWTWPAARWRSTTPPPACAPPSTAGGRPWRRSRCRQRISLASFSLALCMISQLAAGSACVTPDARHSRRVALADVVVEAANLTVNLSFKLCPPDLAACCPAGLRACSNLISSYALPPRLPVARLTSVTPPPALFRRPSLSSGARRCSTTGRPGGRRCGRRWQAWAWEAGPGWRWQGPG